MGGTTGTSSSTPSVSSNPAQSTTTPSLNWPQWATDFAAANPVSPMAAIPASAPDLGAAPDGTANLGFPSPTATPMSTDGTATPVGFNSDPYAAPSGFMGNDGSAPIHLGAGMAPAPAPVDPAADAGLTTPATAPVAPVAPGGVVTYAPDAEASMGGLGAQSTYPVGQVPIDPKSAESFGMGMGQYVDPRLDPYYAASWTYAQSHPGAAAGTPLTAEQIAAGQVGMPKDMYDYNMKTYGNANGLAGKLADQQLYDQLVRQYGLRSASEMALGGGGNVGGGA